jgi:hypothetical protein
MSNYETNRDGKVLPKPITLTPDEVQRVAAGAAASMSNSGTGSSTTGMYPPCPR